MPKFVALLLAFAFSCGAQQPNWSGPYQPCANSAELKKTGHMSIGVRYDIYDPALVGQFHRAFEFWEKLLDAEFFDEPSSACAIAIVRATQTVLKDKNVVARAQFPDRAAFRGWIAVDPDAGSYLIENDAVAAWIHEIGHLLGLKHNPSAASLMYFIDADSRSHLDSSDLRALASLHALRIPHLKQVEAPSLASLH